MPKEDPEDSLRPSQRLARISARTGKPVDKNTPEVPRTASGEAFHAAERAAEFFDHLRVHYRETRRTDVEIPADIKVLLKDGTVFDAGTAVVLNISPSGALLGRVKLGKNSYPTGPFKLELILHGEDYDGIGIEAQPVRFEFEKGGIGVKFDEIFVSVA